LVIGADAAQRLADWYAVDALLAAVHLVILDRPGSSFSPTGTLKADRELSCEQLRFENSGKAIPQRSVVGTSGSSSAGRDSPCGSVLKTPAQRTELALARSGKTNQAGHWTRLTIPPLAISSTEIRAALRSGRSIRGLVPEVVRQRLLSLN
jgi:nicotinic acid mononucleotide adenylyltransferase